MFNLVMMYIVLILACVNHVLVLSYKKIFFLISKIIRKTG